MSIHIKENGESSAVMVQMQMRMKLMSAEYEKIDKENSALRLQLHELLDGRRLKEFDDMASSRDRHIKLTDQLKTEKTHLVETVLELSEEMDAYQKEYATERLSLSRKTHHHLEMERQAHSYRVKMETQILDALADSGLRSNDVLRTKIEAIMRNTKPPKLSQSDSVPPRLGSSAGRPGDDQRLPNFLDAAALRAMEAEQARHLNDYEFEMRGESALVMGRAGSARSGARSIRSNQSRKLLHMSPGKKRGKQAMERDETESVISSVSTHRSAKSITSLSLSWFRPGNGEKASRNSKKSSSGAITVENLAILNIMNGDDAGKMPSSIERNAGRMGKQQKTPGDRNNESAWWPKLF